MSEILYVDRDQIQVGDVALKQGYNDENGVFQEAVNDYMNGAVVTAVDPINADLARVIHFDRPLGDGNDTYWADSGEIFEVRRGAKNITQIIVTYDDGSTETLPPAN